MRAWTAPHLPVLPGRGQALRLYDTSAAAVRPTSPGPTAMMYVCGITPYDSTHLGHAATYLAFDLVGRLWRDAGHDVTYVQNVTDVDDPLLERAAETGQDWRDLAHQQTQLFREDMEWLGVIPPQHYIGAVDSIPLVTELIGELQKADAVYSVDDDLYFSVRADPRFGHVSRLDEPEMLALFGERGGDPDRPGKKDPLDCLLWRAERPGEPSWPSPFGRGRPGWHIECTAIALRHLGTPFDVQGGGSDLAFPHHEMSASHAHVATGGTPFAHAFVHAGMVGLHGEKMSKSLGNLVFAADLRTEGADPAVVRLALLGAHYRSDREWTGAVRAEATDRLSRWREAVSAPSAADAAPVVAEVRHRLADDLDTPGAIRAIDRWAEQTRLHGGTDPTAPGLVSTAVDALLGIRL